MRSFRSLAAGSLLALTVLASGAAAVSAAPAGVNRLPIDDAWCFDDVVLQYCTEMNGFFQVVTGPDGRESATSHLQTHVVISKDGVGVAEYTTISNDRFAFAADGTYTFQTVETTRYQDGEMRCRSTSVLRIAEFEVVVDHVTYACS